MSNVIEMKSKKRAERRILRRLASQRRRNLKQVKERRAIRRDSFEDLSEIRSLLNEEEQIEVVLIQRAA